LADSGVASQSVGILVDGEFGWGVGGSVDLDHGSPLGEACTKSVVLLGSLVKIVESLKKGRKIRIELFSVAFFFYFFLT